MPNHYEDKMKNMDYFKPNQGDNPGPSALEIFTLIMVAAAMIAFFLGAGQ